MLLVRHAGQQDARAAPTAGQGGNAADILARWLIAPQELPVGVLTAVLGGGYLLWLMHRATRSATVSNG